MAQTSLTVDRPCNGRAGSLYGELARFVLRLLGYRGKPQEQPQAVHGPPGAAEKLSAASASSGRGRARGVARGASPRGAAGSVHAGPRECAGVG